MQSDHYSVVDELSYERDGLRQHIANLEHELQETQLHRDDLEERTIELENQIQVTLTL